MKKFFTFIAAAFISLSMNAQTTWDFTQEMSEIDATNLTTDTENWKYTASTKRYENKAILTDELVKANGQPVVWFGGLKVNAAASKFKLDNGTKVQVNAAVLITIPGLKANDEIKVQYAGAGASGGRYFEITTGNGTVDEENAFVNTDESKDYTKTKAVTSAETVEPTITVTADGDLTLKVWINAINIYKIESSRTIDKGTAIIPGDDPADPTAAKTWDFSKTPDDVKAVLVAGAALETPEWTYTESSKRYANTAAKGIAQSTDTNLGEWLAASWDGMYIGNTKSAMNADKIRVNIDDYFQMNSNNAYYKIKDLVKDDVVRIRFKSASGTEEGRKFTISNGTCQGESTIIATIGEGGADLMEAEIVVTANGNLVLTQSKAMNVNAITVNAELPNAPSTGIKTVANKQTTANDQYYNLAGQRVQPQKGGLYIVNGKKVIF